MSLHDRIRKLEARNELANTPTPEGFLDADRRAVARRHRTMAEQWGMRGMFTDEDSSLLEDDSPAKAAIDADTINRWRISQGVTDEVIAAVAERARARLMSVGTLEASSDQ